MNESGYPLLVSIPVKSSITSDLTIRKIPKIESFILKESFVNEEFSNSSEAGNSFWILAILIIRLNKNSFCNSWFIKGQFRVYGNKMKFSKFLISHPGE